MIQQDPAVIRAYLGQPADASADAAVDAVPASTGTGGSA
jgi:hypothetical protein